MHPNTPIEAVIFDLGDVLYKWSAPTDESLIPPSQVKSIVKSETWHDYERGYYTEQEVYDKIACEYGHNKQVVRNTFSAVRGSLVSDPQVWKIIRALKAIGVQLYLMSNISKPDMQVLRGKDKKEDWDLFDNIFPSSMVGVIKPDPSFYSHVIDCAGIKPHRTIFIDDKEVNVNAAKSFGMQGIRFCNASQLSRDLNSLLGQELTDCTGIHVIPYLNTVQQ